jgi:hypothetical protein
MKKTLLYISLIALTFGLSSFVGFNGPNEELNTSTSVAPTSVCSFKSKKLYGKVQFVTSNADLKIQYVDSNADIDVQMVTASPTTCGKWQEVKSSPDLKVQIVNSFPDIKVRLVKSNPGMK